MPEQPIRTAADANSIRQTVEYIFDGWYASTPRIDWEEFVDRLEAAGDFDFGAKMDSPAIRRVKSIVQELRKQES